MIASDWSQRSHLPRCHRSPARRAGVALGLTVLALVSWCGEAGAQLVPYGTPTPPPPKPHGFFLFRAPQRPVAQQVVPLQEGPKIGPRFEEPPPDNTRVLVSISRQRAYLFYGNDVVIDTPVSSGKRGHGTPSGSFRISAKEPNHYSNIYGNFLDRNNRVVRSGVSAVIDSAPSGTHFEGAAMRWFMRFNGAVGMHVGILPGYAASHGCVRLPAEIAPLIYQRVKVGTSVVVEE